MGSAQKTGNEISRTIFRMMRTISVVPVIALISALLTPSSAGAITLEEAKKEALKSNISLKMENEKVLGALSVKNDKLTKLFPSLNVAGDEAHSDKEPRVVLNTGEYGTYPLIGSIPSQDIEAFVGKRDTYSATVQFQQPIFEGGKIYYTYLSSKAHEDISRWDEKQTTQDVLFSVEQAYFNLLKSEEIYRHDLKHEDDMKAHLNDIEIKYKEGRVSLNDVLKVKVEEVRANESVIKSDNGRQVAKGRINVLLNRPFAAPVEEPRPGTLTVEEGRRLAQLNRPAIKSAVAGIEEAAYKRRVAEGGYFPDLKFVAEYNKQTEQPTTLDENWTVMVTLRYTLFEWGAAGERVNAARAVERQMEYNKLMIENQIASDVWQSWLKIQETDKRIEVTKVASAQAEENLRIVKFGFSHGARTSTDVLDAEDLYSRTSLDSINARYDAYLSRSLFRYSIGILTAQSNEP